MYVVQSYFADEVGWWDEFGVITRTDAVQRYQEFFEDALCETRLIERDRAGGVAVLLHLGAMDEFPADFT